MRLVALLLLASCSPVTLYKPTAYSSVGYSMDQLSAGATSALAKRGLDSEMAAPGVVTSEWVAVDGGRCRWRVVSWQDWFLTYIDCQARRLGDRAWEDVVSDEKPRDWVAQQPALEHDIYQAAREAK